MTNDGTVQPPRLTLREPGHLRPGSAEQLLTGAEGTSFRDVELSGEDLNGVSIVECELENVRILDSDLSAMTVTESAIRKLTSPHLNAPRSLWRDVSLAGIRVGFADLYESAVDSVHLTSSKLDLVNLRGAQVSDIVLENCAIGELDLTGARATRVQFKACQIETLAVSQARLNHVDLSGAELQEIIGIDALRGTAISPFQLSMLAPAFADHLGVVVTD